MEILRGSLRSNGSPDNKSFKLVYTIPGALADAHTAEGKIQFTDPLPPEDLRTRPGTKYAYRVRTRASKKKDSADSNTVDAKVYPVAERITSLNARVTQNAIELSWPVPALGGAQDAGETLAGYHVYRGELETTLGHLAREGQIVDVVLQSGDRAVVLRVDVISRYAGLVQADWQRAVRLQPAHTIS